MSMDSAPERFGIECLSCLLHLFRDDATRQHVKQRLERFNEGQYADKYYAFNASNHRLSELYMTFKSVDLSLPVSGKWIPSL